MAQLPVEIVMIGEIPGDQLERAVSTANTVQDEIIFSFFPETGLNEFRVLAFDHVVSDDIMDRMSDVRIARRGYHPYLLSFIDAALDGREYTNIFGSDRADEGLAVFTIRNVPDVILPRERLVAYFLYYMAKATLSFLVPGQKNHTDRRGCVYDKKLDKTDLLHSMRARAFCDECRRSVLSRQTVSSHQFLALDKLFAACGDLLRDDPRDHVAVDPRPRAFIGSSSEGLRIAQEMKRQLTDDLAIEIWNEGTVFGLGDATLEALERAVLSYDYGVFVFTPDDELHTRGEVKAVARDNVLFELGLFTGKLTRRRAFVVHPAGRAVALPSDLAGITTAVYDHSNTDLAAALGTACSSIRAAVQKTSAGL
jgi:hypothetical protein